MTNETPEIQDKEKIESELLSPKPEGGSSGDSETESPGDSGSPQDPKDKHNDDDDDGGLSPETKKLILDKINEQKDMPKKRGPGRPPKIKDEHAASKKTGSKDGKDAKPATENKSCYHIVNALYYSICSFLKVKYDDVESKALAEVWQPVYDDFKPDKKDDKILFAVVVTAAVIGSKVMDKKKQGGINADEKENKKSISGEACKEGDESGKPA